MSLSRLAVMLGVAPAALLAQPVTPVVVPAIPVHRDTLANGLTVLLSPDHSSPIVSVTVWYHVGSKNEAPGRTGFAHLFEHMMFQGSAHVAKGEHGKTIEDAGGGYNATTDNDRTTYYETVPVNQLETVLWLESDRMGHLLPAVTQETLDNQRDVVKNERRQGLDNEPFGSAGEVINAALFPESNPYSWPVIGSMTDLSAASLDDVRSFFQRYYEPNNAVLAIVGDIDTGATRALVERYFGDIPRGMPIQRPAVSPATLGAERRLVLEDAKGTEPRLKLAWPTVGRRSPDAPALELLASVLTLDRTSRLTKVLVYDRQLASDVDAGPAHWEDEGSFGISVTPRPGIALTTIEQVTDSVLATLATLATTVPTETEVDRVKHYAQVGAVLELEGFNVRAARMARGETYYGDPGHQDVELRETQAVTAADVVRVAARYLDAGRVVLSMVPAGKLDLVSRPERAYTNVTVTTGAGTDTATTPPTVAAPSPPQTDATPPPLATDADRPRPIPGPPPAARMPTIHMRRLANGAAVAVLENHALPIVSVMASIETPGRAYAPAAKGCVVELASSMMREGTSSMTADQLAEAQAEVGTGVGPEFFWTTTPNVDRSLALMRDQLLHPAFPQGSLDRLTADGIATLRRMKDEPGYHAQHVFSTVMYGAAHPYARSAIEQCYAGITRADVVTFHRDYYRPRNTTFIVYGDITPDSAAAKLARAFGQWTPGGKAGRVPMPAPAGPVQTQIFLYDRPGAPQSVIRVGLLGPRRDIPDFYALQLMNIIVGGASNSRINLDLREAHGYTYGAHSGFEWRRAPERSTFVVETNVATLKTDSALVDLVAQLRDVRTARPVTDSEFTFAKRSATLGMPLQFTTTLDFIFGAMSVFNDDLPLDYYDHLWANYQAVTLDQVRRTARRYLDVSRMAIVIEGDRKAIEPGLRAALIAPVVVVDDAGKAIASP